MSIDINYKDLLQDIEKVKNLRNATTIDKDSNRILYEIEHINNNCVMKLVIEIIALMFSCNTDNKNDTLIVLFASIAIYVAYIMYKNFTCFNGRHFIYTYINIMYFLAYLIVIGVFANELVTWALILLAIILTPVSMLIDIIMVIYMRKKIKYAIFSGKINLYNVVTLVDSFDTKDVYIAYDNRTIRVYKYFLGTKETIKEYKQALGGLDTTNVNRINIGGCDVITWIGTYRQTKIKIN